MKETHLRNLRLRGSAGVPLEWWVVGPSAIPTPLISSHSRGLGSEPDEPSVPPSSIQDISPIASNVRVSLSVQYTVIARSSPTPPPATATFYLYNQYLLANSTCASKPSDIMRAVPPHSLPLPFPAPAFASEFLGPAKENHFFFRESSLVLWKSRHGRNKGTVSARQIGQWEKRAHNPQIAYIVYGLGQHNTTQHEEKNGFGTTETIERDRNGTVFGHGQFEDSDMSKVRGL